MSGSPGVKATPLPLLVAAMALVIVPLVTLSQLAAHLRLDVVDDQMFGYYGWRIAHGATVYLDVWDNKPPGIYWINALGFLIGGDNYAGVICLCVAALLAAHVCFFVIASSVYFPAAAAVVTALASFYMTHARYQGGTNRTETFLIPCELAAVALYVRGFARDRWWKWYAAGLLCGGAVLFKQVGFAAWGAMGLHTMVLMLTQQLPWRSGLRRGLLLAGGLATTLGVAGAYLVAQGALSEAWFAAVTFNRAYFVVGDSRMYDQYVAFTKLSYEIFPILLMPTLLAIGAALHAGLWWFRPALRPPEIEMPLKAYGAVCPRYMLLFGIWLAIAFYGALISPHAFRHYLLPSIPPLLLFGGYLVNAIQAEFSLLARMQSRAWVTVTFVAMGYFASDAAVRHWEEVSKVWIERDPHIKNGHWVMTASRDERIGDRVAQLASPSDRIQCWGYQPGVYLRARRANVCRYTTTEKIGQVKQEADFVATEIQARLDAEPPAVFVVSSGDYLWVRGELKDVPSAGWIGAWLAEWIGRHYEQVDDIENIFIFRRK